MKSKRTEQWRDLPINTLYIPHETRQPAKQKRKRERLNTRRDRRKDTEDPKENPEPEPEPSAKESPSELSALSMFATIKVNGEDGGGSSYLGCLAMDLLWPSPKRVPRRPPSMNPLRTRLWGQIPGTSSLGLMAETVQVVQAAAVKGTVRAGDNSLADNRLNSYEVGIG